MRLVFFGTGIFAVPILEALGDRVCLVVTQPDRPSGRGMKLQSTPVKHKALEMGLSIESPEKARDPIFVEKIRALRPDALVVASYGQILSQSLLDSAIRGGINLHGSILPKYRGAAPIQRCIEAGDTLTGVTLMQMDKGMDTGDIIAIEKFSIPEEMTYGELEPELGILAAQMTSRWIDQIVKGDYPRIAQSHEAATYAQKIDKSEAEINFMHSVKTEFDKYRAFTPSPGVTMGTKFGKIRLSKLGKSESAGEMGTVLATNPDLIVALSEGSLVLYELQPEGKKRMTGRDFANGMRIRPGDQIVHE